MTSERRIEVTLLLQRKRAPGGHWSSYRAVYCDDPHGLVGYGTTLREARLDLEKQSVQSGLPVDARDVASTRGARGALGGAGQDA
jgi:hypothetical protein